MNMIVVLAVDHPERDSWVDRASQEEADRGDGKLPPYQGVHRILPEGTPVHVFADPVMFEALRGRWAALNDSAQPHLHQETTPKETT